MSKQPRCKKDINILAFDGQCASAHLWWSICRSCNWKIQLVHWCTSQKDAIFRKNTHKTNCLALSASSDCQKRQASFSDVWNCVDIFKQEKGPCCAYLHALNEQIKHISPAPCSAFWKFIPPSFGDANEILHHLTHQQNLVHFIYPGIEFWVPEKGPVLPEKQKAQEAPPTNQPNALRLLADLWKCQ